MIKKTLIEETYLNKIVGQVKNDILGKRYRFSFAFIDKKRSEFLNKTYRKENKPTDVLSFSLEKDNGEILICPEVAKIKSVKFGMTYENYLLFLVIHAVLHLKGFKHGSKMERYEIAYYNRYRHRHL
jgi:probable rRNA maturation factor